MWEWATGRLESLLMYDTTSTPLNLELYGFRLSHLEKMHTLASYWDLRHDTILINQVASVTHFCALKTPRMCRTRTSLVPNFLSSVWFKLNSRTSAESDFRWGIVQSVPPSILNGVGIVFCPRSFLFNPCTGHFLVLLYTSSMRSRLQTTGFLPHSHPAPSHYHWHGVLKILWGLYNFPETYFVSTPCG